MTTPPAPSHPPFLRPPPAALSPVLMTRALSRSILLADPGYPRRRHRSLPHPGLRRRRANIACVNPLGGIMATITHWFGTAGKKKSDTLLPFLLANKKTTKQASRHCVTLSFLSSRCFCWVICLRLLRTFLLPVRSSLWAGGCDPRRMLLPGWKRHVTLKALGTDRFTLA